MSDVSARGPAGRLAQLVDLWRQWQQGPAPRARRVLLLVLAIWVFNVFDLNFTLLACKIGGFEELNPVARMFIASDEALTIFKLGLTLPSTLIFLLMRRRLVTEIGCWMLLGAHAVLAGMWVIYFANIGQR